MSKPYDATGKGLFETDPAGWAAFMGVIRPPGKIRLADSDLSAVTAAADKVVWVEDAPPWVLHVEFQSGRDPSISRRMMKYNALLHDRHAAAVATVLVLLTPEADAPNLSGRYEVKPPFGPGNSFGYTVVRVWELPPEQFAEGPLALLPLAPVSAVAASEVHGVLLRAANRLRTEADPATSKRLWTAIEFLLTLRYGNMTADDLIDMVEREEGITFLPKSQARRAQKPSEHHPSPGPDQVRPAQHRN